MGFFKEMVQGKIHANSRPKMKKIQVRVIQIYGAIIAKCQTIVQLDALKKRANATNATNLDML